MEKERWIGIDFGTSTSVMRVQRYEENKTMLAVPAAVTFNNGSTMVPTLIQKNTLGKGTYYGYDAEIPRKNGRILSNFKMDLESEDEAVRQAAREYTEAFFDYLYQQYRSQSEGGYLGDPDDREMTRISYPVKWKAETKAFMQQAAEKAGFPNVSGMDEAQAAVRAVINGYEEMLYRKGFLEEKKPVHILLIDMGAGTTDLVLCRHTPGESLPTEILAVWPKDGNASFGGREIDEILKAYIGQYIPKEQAEIADRKIGTGQYKNWKEAIVSPSLGQREEVDYFSALDDFLDYWEIEASYGIDREGFESYAEDYLRQFPDLVQGCLQEGGLKGRDVDLVVLTGGHSQWYFVREILDGTLEKFGNPDLEKIRQEPERILSIALPQETVALGLVSRKEAPPRKNLMVPAVQTKEAADEEKIKALQVYTVIEGYAKNNVILQSLMALIGGNLLADGAAVFTCYVPMLNQIRKIYGKEPLEKGENIQILTKCIRFFVSDMLLDTTLGRIPLAGAAANFFMAAAMTWRIGFLFGILTVQEIDIKDPIIEDYAKNICRKFPKKMFFKRKKPTEEDAILGFRKMKEEGGCV